MARGAPRPGWVSSALKLAAASGLGYGIYSVYQGQRPELAPVLADSYADLEEEVAESGETKNYKRLYKASPLYKKLHPEEAEKEEADDDDDDEEALPIPVIRDLLEDLEDEQEETGEPVTWKRLWRSSPLHRRLYGEGEGASAEAAPTGDQPK